MSGHDTGRSWLPTLGITLALTLAVAAVVLLWGMATRADALRFRTLLVSGALSQVTPDEVRGVVQPHLAAGYLAIDLAALQDELEALPWVATATVRREWPGTLRVSVVEEVPVAVWDGRFLVNAAGQVFAESAPPAGTALPQLEGPAGSASELIEMHAAMQGALAAAGLAPTRVALSARRAWEVTVDGTLTVRLGRQHALARLERFTRVAAPLVLPQRALVAYVDMRYTNGFAVGWRSGQGRTQPGRGDVQEA